jgi:hypothetical protein
MDYPQGNQLVGVRHHVRSHCQWSEDAVTIENLAEMKKELTDLASVLNTFKSEAVQLRLLEFILGEVPVASNRPEQKDPKPSAKRRRKQPNPSADKTADASSPKKKKAASGPGAVATVAQLLEGDFFKKPRVSNDIIKHCKDNLARTFKANEFSGKLGQLVRTNQLTRAKNADNQYEYKKP